MAMKKSIGRTLAHVDVAANTSVRIHEDFFNSHPCYQHPSQKTSEMAPLSTEKSSSDSAWRVSLWAMLSLWSVLELSAIRVGFSSLLSQGAFIDA
jgi:hypothetical protein